MHLRLRWALLEKRAVEKILQQLGNAANDLALVLQILHMYVHWLRSVEGPSTSTSTLSATTRYLIERLQTVENYQEAWISDISTFFHL